MTTPKSKRVWSVAEAQANLAEVLRLAGAQAGSLAGKQRFEVELLRKLEER